MKAFAKILKDINPNFLDDLKARLADGKVVKVGVPAGPTEPESGVPLALVGAVHEFGAPSRGIPERPWLRTSIRENKTQFVRLNRVNLVRVIRGQISMDQALEMLGMMAKAAVVQKIRKGPFAPLHPDTVRAKGSSKPLIDTGNFIQSVNYEVGEP
jgi:hypothetical protein